LKRSETNFIQALMPAAVIRFKTLAHPLQLKGSHIIFEEDDRADSVYFIETGHIKIYHNTSLGKMSMISIREPGDIVGIAAVLLGASRSAFAETIGNSQLWCMDGQTFKQFIHEFPELAVQLAIIHGKYLRESQQAMGNLLYLDADRRLAWLLMKLANHISTPHGEKLRITIQLTHQDMANMIGSCRQTVTTVLGRFKKAGIIYISKSGIDIVDSHKLNQYVV